MKGSFREKWMDRCIIQKKKEKNRILLRKRQKDRAKRPYECFCCYSEVEILNITPHLPNTDILSIATPAFVEAGSKYIFFQAALLSIVFPSKACVYDSNYSLTSETVYPYHLVIWYSVSRTRCLKARSTSRIFLESFYPRKLFRRVGIPNEYWRFEFFFFLLFHRHHVS